MGDNRDRKCSGVMVKVSGATALNPFGGTKSACKHVNILTLKSVMELRKSA